MTTTSTKENRAAVGAPGAEVTNENDRELDSATAPKKQSIQPRPWEQAAAQAKARAQALEPATGAEPAKPDTPQQVNGTEVRLLHVTFFEDWYAGTLTTKDMAIWDLRDRILQATPARRAICRGLSLQNLEIIKVSQTKMAKAAGVCVMMKM